MGKKNRKSRRLSEDEEDEENGLPSNDDTGHRLNPNDKGLDFAQRRELQRQAASEKRRQKMKCYLCGKAGHVRRECPGISDDGRGMSRYKGISDVKTAVSKRNHQKGLKQHQQQQSSASQFANHIQVLKLPEGFSNPHQPRSDEEQEVIDCEPFFYYDTGCDIAATLDYFKCGRGKHKISMKEAIAEYLLLMNHATKESNLGGVISRSWLKVGRPWMSPLPGDDSFDMTDIFYFSVGLHRDFLINDNNLEEVTAALLETQESNSRIICFFCDVNYSDDFLKRAGCDKESQLRRLKATFEAAGQSNRVIQLRTLPGAVSLPNIDGDNCGSEDVSSVKERVKGTRYAEMLLGVQSVIMEYLTKFPNLKIHWSCWTGLAPHMLSLLQSIPDNLMIGFDGSCSFSKAQDLHECAFEISLNNILLESSTTIPSHVANALGRDAAYHSGTIPFSAEAIAVLKKTVTAAQVASAAATNTVAFYPELMGRGGILGSRTEEDTATKRPQH